MRNFILSTDLKHTDAHGHHFIELPSEWVKIITTILLDIYLPIILHQASFDGSEICIIAILIYTGLEHCLYSKFLAGVYSVGWTWAISFAINICGRSLALTFDITCSIKTRLRLDFEPSLICFHEVNSTALRRCALLIITPGALIVVETSKIDASCTSTANLTYINIKLN